MPKPKPLPADVINKKCEQAQKTRVLALRECGLSSLPAAATTDAMAAVRTADLSLNALKSLPESLGKLTGMQNLTCTQNALSSLPATIGQMAELQKLVLTGNQLSSLPVELSQLRKLKELKLDNNRLGPVLPDVFEGELGESLEDLDVSGNAIETLPRSLGRLAALQRLILTRNALRELPAVLGSLGRLRTLEAADNSVATVPAAVVQAASLSELWLRGNPIDRLKLQETPGFDAFLERRKARIDAKIDSKIVGAVDLSVCGLD